MATRTAFSRVTADLPHGVVGGFVFLLVLAFINLTLGLTREFGETILAGLLSLLVATVWLCFWLVGLLRSWKQDWHENRSRFALTFLSLPVGMALLVLITTFAGSVVRSNDVAKFEAFLSDERFIAAVENEEHSFEFEGVRVKIDRSDTTTRLAFDEMGYVVRSSAYVYDPTGEVAKLKGSSTNWYFGSELSHCDEVRGSFYMCSFS